MADALPQKRAADGPPEEVASAAAEPPPPAGNTPVEYLTLSANAEPLRLDSLCTNCMRNGTTTMLMTKIPFFREVVLMAFECPHCNMRNSEVQMGGFIPDKGVRFELRVDKGDMKSLSRQVVKGDTATVRIPELDLEMPPLTQRGTMTTVEGVLSNAARDLRLLQAERGAADPALAASVEAFCERLDACAAGDTAFTLQLDDPAGNSALEWFGDLAGGGDPALSRVFYERSREQNVAIGCMGAEQAADEEAAERKAAADARSFGAGAPKLGCTIAHTDGADIMSALSRYSAPEEVMVFPGACPACRLQADTRMFATRIPYFREVVVMCTSCDGCGYRNSDLRAGGAIPPRGRELMLSVATPRDLSRDVIKSETADVAVPELELELGCGTLGGRVTTVEGLLCEVRDALQRTRFSAMGDSARPRVRSEWEAFFAGLEECITGARPFTLVLRDPLASCYISADTEDPAADPKLRVREFDRTFEEDEELGLHDMDTGEANDGSAAGARAGAALVAAAAAADKAAGSGAAAAQD